MAFFDEGPRRKSFGKTERKALYKTVYEEEHFARIAYSIADAMLDVRNPD